MKEAVADLFVLFVFAAYFSLNSMSNEICLPKHNT